MGLLYLFFTFKLTFMFIIEVHYVFYEVQSEFLCIIWINFGHEVVEDVSVMPFALFQLWQTLRECARCSLLLCVSVPVQHISLTDSSLRSTSRCERQLRDYVRRT
jgi:hypothetical protein